MKRRNALNVKKVFVDEIKLGNNAVIAPKWCLSEPDDDMGNNIILDTRLGWYQIFRYEVDYGGNELGSRDKKTKAIEISYKNMPEVERKNLQFEETDNLEADEMVYLFDYAYVKKNLRDEEGCCSDEWEDKMYDLTHFDNKRPHDKVNGYYICDDRGIAIGINGYGRMLISVAESGDKVVAIRIIFKENY